MVNEFGRQRRILILIKYIPLCSPSLLSGGTGCVLMVYGLNAEKMNCERIFNLFCLYGNVVKVNTTSILPWVPETFLARFRFLSSLYSDPLEKFFLATSAYCVGLRPAPKIPAVREKSLWYPGYLNPNRNTKFKAGIFGAGQFVEFILSHERN